MQPYASFELAVVSLSCVRKGLFVLWGEVIVFSKHPVEEPFVFNVFHLQMSTVLTRFGC